MWIVDADAATRVPLWLDHVSVEVPDLAAAVEHLDSRLGLRATVSEAAPERHSRVYMDRSYLEVSARPGSAGWKATAFFLRFAERVTLRAHLEAVGLGYRFGEYEGVDGTWDDVEIIAGPLRLPTLIRRTRPSDVARDWPPTLAEPHPCGARTLAEVHVGVPSLDVALDVYGRLLMLSGNPEPVADPRSGRSRVELPTSSGRIVLLGGGTGEVERIVLSVASLHATRGRRQGLSQYEGDSVAWLDLAETFGLELGFIET
jgi:Glyoxalase-like domain